MANKRKPAAPAATFEVFQQDTKFRWYVKDGDDTIIDSWAQHTLHDVDIDSDLPLLFNSETDAITWIRQHHAGAKNVHSYNEGI